MSLKSVRSLQLNVVQLPTTFNCRGALVPVGPVQFTVQIPLLHSDTPLDNDHFVSSANRTRSVASFLSSCTAISSQMELQSISCSLVIIYLQLCLPLYNLTDRSDNKASSQ